MVLPDLADWSAFLEQVLLTLESHNSGNRTIGGHYMEGMGLKFTPVIVRCLLSPLSMFRSIAGIKLVVLIANPNNPNRGYNLPPASLPPPPPPAQPFICATHDITVVVNKAAQNSAVLAS